MFLSGQNPPKVFPFFLCFTILSNSIFVLTMSIYFFVKERLWKALISVYIYLLFPAILSLQGPSLLFSRVQFFFSLFYVIGTTLLSLSLSLSCKFLKWVSFSSQILSFCFNKNPSNKKKDNSLIKYVCNKRYFILKYAIKFVTEVK